MLIFITSYDRIPETKRKLIESAVAVISGYCIALLMQLVCYRRLVDLKYGRYSRCYLPGLMLAIPIVAVIGLLRIDGIDAPILALGTGLVVSTAMMAASVRSEK
jgi:hypothetical protein